MIKIDTTAPRVITHTDIHYKGARYPGAVVAVKLDGGERVYMRFAALTLWEKIEADFLRGDSTGIQFTDILIYAYIPDELFWKDDSDIMSYVEKYLD